jgi:cytochrome c peroxidase
MTPQQLDAVEAFLRTLSGSQLYTDVRWSDPFDANGNLTVLPLPTVSAQAVVDDFQMRVYPNPASDRLFVDLPSAGFTLTVHSQDGRRVLHTFVTGSTEVRVSEWPAGIYILQADNAEDDLHYANRFIIK